MTAQRFIELQIERQHRLSADGRGLVRAARRLFRLGHNLPRCWFRLEVGYVADHMMKRAIFLMSQ